MGLQEISETCVYRKLKKMSMSRCGQCHGIAPHGAIPPEWEAT